MPRDGAAASLEVRRHVDSIKKLAEASVNVIRNMTLLLRPSMLDDLGLVPALEWQAREVSKTDRPARAPGGGRIRDQLSDELKTCIYRVVQEALHNCVRHSQARTVKVVVRQEPSKIVLSGGRRRPRLRRAARARVGAGRHGGARPSSGGAFEVESRPGAGTRVAVELPIAVSTKTIRILLADDHTVMRSGLRLLLERQPNLQVVGEASDGRQAVDMAAARSPTWW